MAQEVRRQTVGQAELCGTWKEISSSLRETGRPSEFPSATAYSDHSSFVKTHPTSVLQRKFLLA